MFYVGQKSSLFFPIIGGPQSDTLHSSPVAVGQLKQLHLFYSCPVTDSAFRVAIETYHYTLRKEFWGGIYTGLKVSSVCCL